MRKKKEKRNIYLYFFAKFMLLLVLFPFLPTAVPWSWLLLFYVLIYCPLTHSCKSNNLSLSFSNTKLKRSGFAKVIVSNIVTSVPMNLPINDIKVIKLVFFIHFSLHFSIFKATSCINKLLHSVRLNMGRNKSNPLVLYILQWSEKERKLASLV